MSVASLEGDNNLIGLDDIRGEVVIAAPRGKKTDFLPVNRLIVVRNETHHSCVICRLLRMEFSIGHQGL